GNIYAMNFAEMPGQGLHQPAGATADFERSPSSAVGLCGQALQLRLKLAQHVRRRGFKLCFLLIAPAEGDVVVRVFASALVPIGAHALADGIGPLLLRHDSKVAQRNRWTIARRSIRDRPGYQGKYRGDAMQSR